MLDTIKLTLPSSDALLKFISSNSEKLQRLSGSGQVLWERSWVQSALPSHFAGLRIAYSPASEKIANGIKNAKDIVEFEFSVAKWASPAGYNHRNTSLIDDLESVKRWVRSFNEFAGMQYPYNMWTLTRADLSEVYTLIGGSVDAFLEQCHVKMSSYTNAEGKTHKYDGSVYYPSSWIAKKIYDKFKEWRNHEKYKYKDLIKWGYLDGDAVKEEGSMLHLISSNHSEQLKASKRAFKEKYGKEPVPAEEIESLKNCLRLEVEFRRDFLVKHGYTSIDDILKLEDRFHTESVKWLSIKNLSESLDKFDVNEYFIIDRCKRVGYKQARIDFLQKFSLASFYRVRKSLRAKEIFVEYLQNKDFRSEINDVDVPTKFELRLAA